MVSTNRSTPKTPHLDTDAQSYASDPSRTSGKKRGNTPWAQRGILALAATSSLFGQSSAQLTPFAGLPESGPVRHRGGLKKIPTPLKPGHASLSLVANRSAIVTAPPAFAVSGHTWFGVSNPQGEMTQANKAPSGRRLLGLTPFGGGGGGNSPSKAPVLAPALAPASLPPTASCSSPNAPSPAPVQTGSLVVSQLQGCPFADYSAPVNVEGQAFLAIADTGSTTFAVVSNNCTDCDVKPVYKPGSKAKDDHKSIESDYGKGAWLGELTNADVSFAGGPAANIAFGAIYDQKDWISGNNCDLTSNSPGPSINQAIMGLGGPQLLVNNTDSWVEKTNSSFAYPAITFGLCDQNGAIYIGGYPQNNTASPLIFTPMATPKESVYIAVAMETMSVGNTNIGAKFNDFGYTIVDTGSTAIYFPPDVYSAIASGISKGSQGAITQDFFDQGNCIQLDNTSIADVDGQAPPLTFNFYNSANTSSTNSLTVPATNSYLLAQSDGNGGLIVCPVMANAGSDNPQTLLGNTIMRGFLTIFDYKTQQMGFSVSKNVCKSS